MHRVAAPAPAARPVFRTLPPLSLYVHLPWCLKKCPYCDFNSHEWRGGGDGPPEGAYVDALVADLEQALPSVWGRKVSTVFLGGGTPSLFSPEAIDRLLAAIRARLPLVAGAEVTMEANPGTFERRRFEGFRDAGVNRLSIGIQSFAPRHLAALGRVHDAHLGELVGPASGDVLALPQQVPRRGLDEPRCHPHHGRLARSVGTEQGEHRAGRDGDVDPEERAERPVARVDVTQLEQHRGVAGGGRRSGGLGRGHSLLPR